MRYVVAVELGNPIKKLNRQSLVYPPLTYSRVVLYIYYIYLTHLLSLHLCRAMWAQFKWLPVYELCILSRGELLRSKLKIIHSFFLYFLLPLSLSLTHSRSKRVVVALKIRLKRWHGYCAVDTPRPPTHKKNIRFAFISAHKMHNSQISI